MNVYNLEDKDIQNKIVIDIGSYWGFFSFRCLEMGAKKAYCFEPQIDNYKKLVEISSNNLNIKSYNLAIFDGSINEVSISSEEYCSNIWGQKDKSKYQRRQVRRTLVHACDQGVDQVAEQ